MTASPINAYNHEQTIRLMQIYLPTRIFAEVSELHFVHGHTHIRTTLVLGKHANERRK